jgi:hypothetical protein
MEFTLECPTDGMVELGLEDISTVILRSPEAVDVVFACPYCGTSLRASLQVPNLLVAAMELSRYVEGIEVDAAAMAGVELTPIDAPGTLEYERDVVADHYCEYFRRLLDDVECVEDLLAEIDAST